ncbi:Uncharacterized protein BP5553_06377 [Venustampulla echinocandica]|uniref:Uncharacterized protein n=1 Tax=Venustampulla echinocandica TaxID=2656787 RepID=A0A370TJS1_9HELO|nr:Uncharacterized protein BP5553_06377 [Venustampulla echinocandica]RDL35765.1 Uncharacterized protein BP5553_06377 [Venustampulla echinocandica]
MLFSKVLPLSVFASLAAAQGPHILATFSTHSGEIFDVKTHICINFQQWQPIYNTLQVTDPFECELYYGRGCNDEVDRFYPGDYEITHVYFKSVRCHLLDD